MNVLIIENDQKCLIVINALLSKWGHHVFKAESAAEGLAVLSANKIKLVLMDIFLDDAMGYDLIPRIKSLSPDTKIITMTGNSTRELESLIRTQGVLFYLIKPFEIMHLNAIMNHLEPNKSNPNQHEITCLNNIVI